MKLSIHKVHYPVMTLGYGRRVGIWLQGCSIKCPDCINKDTWPEDNQCDIEVDKLMPSLRKWLENADGVTVSGGEPLDQPHALASLLQRLRKACSGDILLYTGYERQVVFRRFANIATLSDVLVTGPYKHDAGCNLMLRGSDNQEVILLSDIARSRYPADINSRPWPEIRQLDIVVGHNVAWMAGIPKTNELARLKRKLTRYGLKCAVSDKKATARS